MSLKAVDIITYKKAIEFKSKNNASWAQTATKLNLSPPEIKLIREHYYGFLEAKRIEEEREMEHIKKLANQNNNQ